MIRIITLLLAILSAASAFTQHTKPSFNPLPTLTETPQHKSLLPVITAITTSAFAAPLIALAEDAGDDYEYGAVSAPIGIAWAAGVGVIATALLPVFLRGGEEAFEEMKERDSEAWGSGRSDALNRRRK
mmetsp:Transcript_17892/g.22261  ORF Transcript_17892/g.22261 Transcript_17892/m.22261 type:complete len:129 (+) Transcript_17892:78-464(+)